MLFEEEEVLVIVQSLQSCPTLGDPVDRSPPDSSVDGILQAGILEWVQFQRKTKVKNYFPHKT